MPNPRRCATALLLLGAAAACHAQNGAAAATSAAASGPAPAASAAAARAGGESQKRVTEDAHVRIEEVRFRGQTQRITVVNKGGERSYEILMPPLGKDPSQDRGAAGQRTWSIFDF